jgi:hypothetical protein
MSSAQHAITSAAAGGVWCLACRFCGTCRGAGELLTGDDYSGFRFGVVLDATGAGEAGGAMGGPEVVAAERTVPVQSR